MKKRKVIMRIRQAGNWPSGDLLVESLDAKCADLEGPVVRLIGTRGGWVMAKEDILKLARLLEGLGAETP